MVVDLRARVIFILDSLSQGDSDQVQQMKAFLAEGERNAAEMEAIPRSPYQSRQVTVPQQTNGYDCGVFTLHFAEKFVSSFSSEGFLIQLVSPLLFSIMENKSNNPAFALLPACRQPWGLVPTSGDPPEEERPSFPSRPAGGGMEGVEAELMRLFCSLLF